MERISEIAMHFLVNAAWQVAAVAIGASIYSMQSPGVGQRVRGAPDHGLGAWRDTKSQSRLFLKTGLVGSRRARARQSLLGLSEIENMER